MSDSIRPFCELSGSQLMLAEEMANVSQQLMVIPRFLHEGLGPCARLGQIFA